MTAAQNKHCIRRWPAAYYFPRSKKWLTQKWVQGTLFVDFKGVTFYQRSAKDEALRTIPFSSITGIRKGTSTMIFSALVISVKEETHWFSSLPNREAAYVIIEHFWRERLIPRKPNLSNISKRTKLGTELLQMAEDSETTLQAAGTMLQRQGEQLDNAIGVMFDLNSDLNVAEKFISGFENWVGHWKLPKAMYTNEPLEIIDSKTVPTLYDFPVLYVSWSEGAGSSPKNGTLRISRDGITILDSDQINVYHYHRKGVSAIRVLSPWEMTVSKYLIGQADISYLLMSTHLVHVLKALEPIYKEKMDFVEPLPGLEPIPMPETPPAWSVDSSADDGQISPPPQVCPLKLDTELLLTNQDPEKPKSTAPDQTQTQLPVAKEEMVTEAEAKELCDVVARMKSMAVDINNEQAAQLEKIDTLTDTVERATDRIKEDNTRIKHLMK